MTALLIGWPAAHGGVLLAVGCAGALLAAAGLAGAGLARTAGEQGAMPPAPAAAPMLLDSEARTPQGVRIPEQREARR